MSLSLRGPARRGLGRVRRVPGASLRLPLLVLALIAAATTAGCSIPDPVGEGPLRYRDAVFPEVKETPDQQYGEAVAGGKPQALLLDLYEPAGDTAQHRPAFVWAHGGGFAVGSRKDVMSVALARNFAQRGYVVVSISYRLLAGEICGGEDSATRCSDAALAAMDDQKAAVRWLRRNEERLRIDTSRIAVGGASAGAVASLLTGATQDVPSDSGNPGFSQDVASVFSVSGGLPISAVFGPGDAPTLFWHGTEDTVVPYSWAQANSDAMQAKGAIGILRSVEGAGHVPWSTQSADIDRQARNWLYRSLALQYSPDKGGFPGAPTP